MPDAIPLDNAEFLNKVQRGLVERGIKVTLESIMHAMMTFTDEQRRLLELDPRLAIDTITKKTIAAGEGSFVGYKPLIRPALPHSPGQNTPQDGPSGQKPSEGGSPRRDHEGPTTGGSGTKRTGPEEY